MCCVCICIQVGSVIGKKGSNVTRIRQECSVFISILKAPENVKERIITIKGTSTSIALACKHIAETLKEAQLERARKAPQGKSSLNAPPTSKTCTSTRLEI